MTVTENVPDVAFGHENSPVLALNVAPDGRPVALYVSGSLSGSVADARKLTVFPALAEIGDRAASTGVPFDRTSTEREAEKPSLSVAVSLNVMREPLGAVNVVCVEFVLLSVTLVPAVCCHR